MVVVVELLVICDDWDEDIHYSVKAANDYLKKEF